LYRHLRRFHRQHLTGSAGGKRFFPNLALYQCLVLPVCGGL
jgi:hypothetical protein